MHAHIYTYICIYIYKYIHTHTHNPHSSMHALGSQHTHTHTIHSTASHKHCYVLSITNGAHSAAASVAIERAQPHRVAFSAPSRPFSCQLVMPTASRCAAVRSCKQRERHVACCLYLSLSLGTDCWNKVQFHCDLDVKLFCLSVININVPIYIYIIIYHTKLQLPIRINS